MTAAKVGPAIGAWIAGKLILGYGWKTMFLALGLGSLLWLIPWLALVKDDDRQIEKAAKTAGPQSGGVSFARLLASPVIWGTIIGTFCYMYFVYFCMTWMPAYFAERRHLSLETMGTVHDVQFRRHGDGGGAGRLGGRHYDLPRRRSGPRAESVHHRRLRDRLDRGVRRALRLGSSGAVLRRVLA